MLLDPQEIAKYALGGSGAALVWAVNRFVTTIRRQNAANRLQAHTLSHEIDEEKDDWRAEITADLKQCREDHKALEKRCRDDHDALETEFRTYQDRNDHENRALRDEIGSVTRINGDLRAENARLAGQVNVMSGILNLLKEQIATPSHGLVRPPIPPEPEP